jgi:AcrR family transcriptional regulator
MPETPEPHLRRQPQQARGQQRIQKILDAAEHIFADVGYDNATTNAIAVRAETSIGSLYQFFPHKEAILKALVLRYLEEMRTLFDLHLTPESLETLSLSLFLERLIHDIAQLHESHQGFRPIFFASQISPAGSACTTELKQEMMQRISLLLTIRNPTLSEQQCAICARTCVALFQSLMSLAMDLQGQERTDQLNELRLVLLSYMQTYLSNGTHESVAETCSSIGLAPSKVD